MLQDHHLGKVRVSVYHISMPAVVVVVVVVVMAATAWPSAYKIWEVEGVGAKIARFNARPICPYKQGEARPEATPSCIRDRYWAVSAVSLFRNYTKMHSTPSGRYGSCYDCNQFRGEGRIGAHWSTRVTLLAVT